LTLLLVVVEVVVLAEVVVVVRLILHQGTQVLEVVLHLLLQAACPAAALWSYQS